MFTVGQNNLSKTFMPGMHYFTNLIHCKLKTNVLIETMTQWSGVNK